LLAKAQNRLRLSDQSKTKAFQFERASQEMREEQFLSGTDKIHEDYTRAGSVFNDCFPRMEDLAYEVVKKMLSVSEGHDDVSAYALT
jgi:hypothetical protein